VKRQEACEAQPKEYEKGNIHGFWGVKGGPTGDAAAGPRPTYGIEVARPTALFYSLRSNVRATSSLIALALLGLSALAPSAVPKARAESKRSRGDILPLSEIRPKMKGYGLTVFEGTRPERFDVEVIDVLHRFMPKQDLILIKTRHPRLEVARVVAGMSGSPIFIDGKMIGAYAYGWTFAREAIAGVTPIENMIAEIDRPIPSEIYGWSLGLHGAATAQQGMSTSGTEEVRHGLSGRNARGANDQSTRQSTNGRQGFSGTNGANFSGSAANANSTGPVGSPPERYNLLSHANQIAQEQYTSQAGQTVRPVSTPLLLGGVTPLGTQIAEKLLGPLGFEPLQAGGDAGESESVKSAPTKPNQPNSTKGPGSGNRADATSAAHAPNATGADSSDIPTRYEDGSAIGVQLVRGDTSAMGLGTVTRVEGDKLVAFGHPMMQAGATALPTSVGKVLWFLASEQRSFKIGMAVRPLGALVADRQASIVVSHSAKAPVIPVKLDIEGVEGISVAPWRFEVAHEKFLTPSFLSMALASAIQSTTAEKRDVSWTLDSEVTIDGLPKLTFEDFGVAVGGMPNSDDITSTNVVEAIGALLNNPWQPIHVVEVKSKLKLRYAREIFRLRGAELLDKEIDAGEPARIKIRLVPYDGPEQERILIVPIDRNRAGDTVTLEIVPGYTESREMAPAENLAELARNLDEPVYLPKSVVVKFTGPGGTMAYHGRVAAKLPPGALDLLSSTNSTVIPATFAATSRSVHPLPFYVLGRDRVSVEIRPVMR